MATDFPTLDLTSPISAMVSVAREEELTITGRAVVRLVTVVEEESNSATLMLS
ncbi:hypothetical protein [Streptomyces goshikiensis]|uniref:hypothetical protein n=1 Tax=Streptomyces goshikiensis TaxID=1942 RepID=UPI0037FAB3FE